MDRRVEEAIARFRLLPRAEHHRAAAGPYEAQAVLLLAEPPLTVEARYLASVAHLPGQGAFLALQSVAEERGNEARRAFDLHLVNIRHEPHVAACGRLCVLVNQGPCRCVVPQAVAELRRRQRALLWACEAIMRPVAIGPK